MRLVPLMGKSCSTLLPFLNGQFDVVSVPATCSDISIKFSRPKVIHAAFAEVKVTEDVKQAVCDELLNRLLEKAKKEGIEMKVKKDVPELSLPRINVHAESSLLAYHLQNPEIRPYCYFGGSKLYVTAVASSSTASIVSQPLSVFPSSSLKVAMSRYIRVFGGLALLCCHRSR
jgi:hypothetical protein